MTKHAEVIYETGAKSVVSIDDMDEFMAGLAEHHRRAISGEPGAPQDQVERDDLDVGYLANMPSIDRFKDRPAERVKRVIIYDQHPVDLHPDTVSPEIVNTLASGMADNTGTLDPHQLVEALRDEMNPTYSLDQGRHNSMFKADGQELSLDFLPDGGDS